MADDVTKADDKTASDEEGVAIATRWRGEIERAEKKFNEYWDRCQSIIDLYKQEKSKETKVRKFAMLWSNIETLKPAVYSRTPEPIVKRRYNDQDPLARSASEMVERALIFNFDKTDLDGRMQEVRDNYLLVGRGTAWVRYDPTFHMVGEGEQAYEALKSERTTMDFVHWRDFLYQQQRTWADVPWVSRKVPMDRDQLVGRFGEEIGKAITLDHKPAGATDGDDKSGWKATIYEIWSKTDNKCFWISKSHPTVLDHGPPPLELEGFFPCPRPVFGTLSGEDLIPTPDYVYYQDQANEINSLTARIGALTESLKLVGFYPAGASENENVIETAIRPGKENLIIGVPSWAAFSEKGGAAQIQWLPIDQVATIIKECIALRKELISDVYQITGISDVVRGESDPRETAKAQGIKAQWGSVRIRGRQSEIARFARDVTRIMGEIIADKFQPETLEAMTGIQLPKQADVDAQFQQTVTQWKQVAMQAQQAGQPAPPQPQPPQVVTIEAVMQLLRDDRMRTFHIDIETDSTIEADQNEQKARMTEYVTAFGEFVTKVMPAGEKAPELIPVFGEILTQSARVFRVSRSLETAIETAMQKLEQRAQQPPAPPQPSPDEQIKLQTTQIKANAEQGKAHAENISTALKVQGDLQKHHHTMNEMAMNAATQPPMPPGQVMQ